MEGQLIAAIVSLTAVISAGATGIIKYLLKQIDNRDARIAEMTKTQTATNDLNAQLAGMWVAQQQAISAGKAP